MSHLSHGVVLKNKLSGTDILHSYRKMAEENEVRTLHSKAALSHNHHRFFGPEEDHRLPYKRDVDRIIHSKAYSRYVDKTQVVYLIENDHITHRSLHVQLVSSFARGIAEILGLNLDLVEAIALGHDVGHPPFGHEGEGYLCELSKEFSGVPFTHPWQSCRLFTELEPLNLGLSVYDGFLCHDGGMCGNKLAPNFGKTWDDHFKEKESKLRDPDGNIWPGTLEGCLVKLCDTMSYLGRDIEDAIILGILKRSEVPKTLLGDSNRLILNVLSQDIIKQSYGKDYIAVSDEVYEALKVLRKFNFERIYTHPQLKVESGKVRISYRILFEYLLNDLEKQGKKSYIWHHFLHDKTPRYLEEANNFQKVIDFISGMTDKYFIKTLGKLIVPKSIEWSV
ncbi:MAG TPA: HD domain-containing protein [Parachlamydiaceae bacterium]|nr:HD domain-containing protein [Parachlamydiaceae bacterium]